MRALVPAPLLLFVADPSLKRGDCKPLKDVVALGLDRSGSNRISERAQQTDAARVEIAKQLGRRKSSSWTTSQISKTSSARRNVPFLRSISY